MSYGDNLAAAAAGLARAHAALRNAPPGPMARASAAVSRAWLYRSLEQQIVAVGNVYPGDLPPVGDLSAPYQRPVSSRSPLTTLAIALRQAPAGTLATDRAYPGDPPPDEPVATALREAYQALQTAGDVLISHTGPRIGAAAPHRPLTTEGIAVLAGVGRADNLAALARLAAAAAAMDVRLSRWMWPEESPIGLQSLLAAAEQDAWRTRNGPLRESAMLVAGGGNAEHAPVLEMAAAPPVDDPVRWLRPNSGRDCVEAVDAARSWLTRHGSELTVGQLASAAGAALAISHYVGHVHLHLARPGAQLSAALVAAAQPWRGVLQAVTELRSPVPAHADHSTMTAALDGAAGWLRSQLRPDGQWRGPAAWGGDPAGRAHWRETARQITARMPDLADLLHQAIGTVHARDGILAATGRLNPRSGGLVYCAQWAPVAAGHRAYRAVGMALANAATHGRQLAAAVGVPPRLGLHDARTARRQAYAPTPNAARLARQWYPQADAMTEPTLPPAGGAGTIGGRQRSAPQRHGRGPVR